MERACHKAGSRIYDRTYHACTGTCKHQRLDGPRQVLAIAGLVVGAPSMFTQASRLWLVDMTHIESTTPLHLPCEQGATRRGLRGVARAFQPRRLVLGVAPRCWNGLSQGASRLAGLESLCRMASAYCTCPAVPIREQLDGASVSNILSHQPHPSIPNSFLLPRRQRLLGIFGLSAKNCLHSARYPTAFIIHCFVPISFLPHIASINIAYLATNDTFQSSSLVPPPGRTLSFFL